ncbi:endonuclease/exonuclease/phosphatase family protein [Nibrella saemangeumensis]|uniref:Endonuclease/exonuclease/phosphatase family protein n=1 Tax=Nibrella saemangeumensis TaxID=1084526 RepID=A0ABP8MM68_9BACT
MKHFLWLLTLWLSTVYAAQAQKITVLTYNIHHGANEQGRLNLIRVGQLIREHKPDLVALQELDSATTRSYGGYQMQQLANLTGMYPLFGKAIDLEAGAYGIGILSKYPILASQNIPLPNPDSTEQRVILCAYVELPNQKTIRFCNTHLDHQSRLNRGMQLAMVNQMLRVSIQPVIWAGDLNARPDEPGIQPIWNEWQDAGVRSKTPTLPHGNARIDYILTRRQSKFTLLKYEVLKEPDTSDHQPVLATYLLK